MNVHATALGAAVMVLALAGTAAAHGGAYRGPPGNNPGAGAVPPGTADTPAPVTRWETWWASNKELYLRSHERMRDDGRAVTPGSDSGEPGAPTREEQDAAKRAELVPVFIEALTDDSFEVRTAAAIALGKTGDPRGAAPLRRAALKDDHKDVRQSAVLALGLIGDQASIPFLYGLLDDRKQDTRTRSFAAFALGLIGGEDATDLLIRFADGRGPRKVGGKRRQPPLVASAFVALGLTDRPEAVPVLQDALMARANDDQVRSFILLSLGRLKDRETLPVAIKMLKREKHAGLRRSAAIAIGKIATPEDAEALDALAFAIRGDADRVARHFAAISLGQIASDAAKARLIKSFRDGDQLDRPFLALALGLAKHGAAAPMLRHQLKKERLESVKASYCIALALMGDMEAVPLIEEAARERGEIWLPGYAAIALGMLGSRSSAPQLRERLAKEGDSRLRMNLAVALGFLHDARAREFLVETVKGRKGSIYERGSAAMSIGVLRLNPAADDLLSVYRDKKEQDLVRAFSVVALGVLADPSPIPKLARFAIDNNYGLTVDPLNEVLTIL